MTDRPSRKNRQENASPELAVVEGIVRGFGSLFALLFKRGQKAAAKISSKAAFDLANHWSAIETHLSHPSTYSLAVTEADKIFDAALQELELAGNNMGERLQAAQKLFNAELYQQIWNAHKLRNIIAHEVGTVVQSQEARTATATFKRALQQLGIPL